MSLPRFLTLSVHNVSQQISKDTVNEKSQIYYNYCQFKKFWGPARFSFGPQEESFSGKITCLLIMFVLEVDDEAPSSLGPPQLLVQQVP